MQIDKINPRYRFPVTDKELDRRLSQTQASLKAADLDCLLIQLQSNIFDSGIRYYLDVSTHDYGSALLIPAEGKIVYLTHGIFADKVPTTLHNVETMYTRPYCQPFPFTDRQSAAVMISEIRERSCRRVGLFSPQLMSYDFVSGLKAELADVEFVDFSKTILMQMAIKSDEEWEMIDSSLRMHERLMAAVPAMIRPGRLEYELHADIEHAARMLGCDMIGNVSVGCARPDTPCTFVTHFYEGGKIEPGDNVTVMIEVSGQGGMYCEVARTFTLGKPTEKLLRLYDIAKNCQAEVAKAARPGVTGGELSQVYNRFVAEYGIGPNLRNIGHSQGYDMMQSPAIADDETMPLAENMFISIHPELFALDNFAICCDNFRITKDGAVRLTRTPQEIVRLDD